MTRRKGKHFLRVRRWWEGEDDPYENDSSDRVVVLGLRKRWGWSARVARAVIFYLRDHHRWAITTAIAVVGAILGYVTFK